MSQRPDSPDEADVITAWVQQHLSEVHTSFPARVESYDHEKQTCSVKPQIQYPIQQPDGSIEYEELPVISSVPVLFPRTAGWFIAFPFDVGDTVLVVVTELSFAHWRETAGDAVTYSGDQRRHHLSNAVAIPGLFVTQKALTHAPPSPGAATPALVLGSDADDGTRLTIQTDGVLLVTRGVNVVMQVDADGTVHIGGPGGNAIADATLTNARFTQILAWANSHTHATAAPGVPSPGLPPLTSLPDVGTTKSKAT